MRWLSRQLLGGSFTLLGVLGVGAAANAQAVNTFTNSTVIVITDAANATPFPSNITVAGQTGVITHVRVRLNAITHAAPLDLTIWLVGPNFATVPLLARPPTSQLSSANLEFDECAPRADGLSGGSLHHQYAAASSLRAVSTRNLSGCGRGLLSQPHWRVPNATHIARGNTGQMGRGRST